MKKNLQWIFLAVLIPLTVGLALGLGVFYAVKEYALVRLQSIPLPLCVTASTQYGETLWSYEYQGNILEVQTQEEAPLPIGTLKRGYFNPTSNTLRTEAIQPVLPWGLVFFLLIVAIIPFFFGLFSLFQLLRGQQNSLKLEKIAVYRHGRPRETVQIFYEITTPPGGMISMLSGVLLLCLFAWLYFTGFLPYKNVRYVEAQIVAVEESGKRYLAKPLPSEALQGDFPIVDYGGFFTEDFFENMTGFFCYNPSTEAGFIHLDKDTISILLLFSGVFGGCCVLLGAFILCRTWKNPANLH